MEEVKLVGITLAKGGDFSSCALKIVLFSIIVTINIGIGTYFVYCRYINLDKNTAAKNDYV